MSDKETYQTDAYLLGKMSALSDLANEVRLDCKRRGWHMEEAAIKFMQEAIRASWKQRADNK